MKPGQFEARECSTQATSVLTVVSLQPATSQVRNGQFISVLFIISVTVDIHGHRFKIYTLVLEIHENADLVLGIKNIFELEGVINSQVCCFNFLNISLPIFPKECIVLKRMYSIKAKGTKINKGRSTINRGNASISYN